ncbi:hypothetical protein M1614_03090 [Candidatus Marsarchaeota archaeon]|nr:hypothetical protein [Candidatus Marsarchaeota archaeon]MCL5089849.1 hypothetical protein [Candidatus Marsarchaeota archaeon]
MKYYDILFDCVQREKLAGFEKIFKISENNNKIFFGSGDEAIIHAIRHGALAVAITNFYINRKIIAEIKEYEATLCIPFSIILEKKGFERTGLLYKATVLAKFALNNKIELSIGSFAHSEQFLNSPLQLIELSKIIKIREEYAKYSLSEVNKRIGEYCEGKT